MNTPDDLHWIAVGDATARTVACPVCGAMGPHTPVLGAPSMSPPHVALTLLRCAGCASGFFDPPGITSFSDLGQNGEDFWRFYVEVGGGVWETIWPTLAERRSGRRSLLDVGCGFGFAVDYWQRTGRGDAVGVELADYGQVGARLLGITVHNRLLQDIPELAGRRFDVVYASEVIEHVPDPSAFVALLAKFVADDGVLVLTTPSVGFVQQVNHSPTLHAALSPGFHGFLLSAQAFGDTARRNGFTHVDVRQFNERQMLWASREPLAVDTAPDGIHADFLRYLEARVDAFDGASPVWQGFAYRSLKNAVNESRFAAAGEVGNRLLDAVAAVYGPHVRDPAAALARLRACNEMADVGKAMPYFLPGFYFYLGATAQYVDRDLARAEQLFRGAVDTTLEACRIGSIFFLDAISLLWPARMALADLAFLRGDFATGARLYAEMAAEGGLCRKENGFAIVGPDLAEMRVPAMIEQLFKHGHFAAAETVLGGYATYIRRQYGDDMLDPGGVDRALANGTVPVPLDPLLAPCFAALARHRVAGNDGDIAAQLGAIADIATRWSGHPRWGRRMQEHAQRVRWLLPAAKVATKPVWSFDMTYTVPKNKGGTK